MTAGSCACRPEARVAAGLAALQRALQESRARPSISSGMARTDASGGATASLEGVSGGGTLGGGGASGGACGGACGGASGGYDGGSGGVSGGESGGMFGGGEIGGGGGCGDGGGDNITLTANISSSAMER